jgi:hypothetical protein
VPTLIQWISQYKVVLALFVITALAASSQSILLGKKKYLEDGLEYNSYNNYTIFRQSFYHLANGSDLYTAYPMEHWDLYKYSPTFSFLFGIFAVLPDHVGLFLWNLVNAIILVIAVYFLPHLTARQKGVILLACVIESMTALQNEQSNGLMAGLIILAFAMCERGRWWLAALLLVMTVYIKIFGLVAFALFLFYPGRWKLAFYSLLWLIVLFFVPLFVVDFKHLIQLYQSWSNMLAADHSGSLGLSTMGWIQSWFKIPANKLLIVLCGAILFMLPYIRFDQYRSYGFRLLGLCSVLIWIVIFNHKAESPTFIIAMTGVSIWYFAGKQGFLDTIFFVVALILVSLSPTDIFPSSLRRNLVEPYVLKAVPCIAIWCLVILDMIFFRKDSQAIEPDEFLPNLRPTVWHT